MKDNTFTFTARSATDPEKMATFTLHNGSVSIELGNMLVQQVGEAYDNFRDEETGQKFATWIKPATTGTLQKLVEPIPLRDFDAEISDEALQTTAWIRTGGLRLAPVMMTWEEVDNRMGAQAFVDELQDRKELSEKAGSWPDPLDYWASWILITIMTIAFPILVIRLWKKRQSS
jgi:hypothetical protein